ncbi:MAG: DUF2281 domain-containing protein [Treponema sp.]|nr:DUF2281 domain-containing protein [Treponema sp.]
MPYTVLEKKLQAIPEQYFEQVSSFLDLILSLPVKKTNKEKVSSLRHPTPGLAKDEFKYPDNINLYDDEVANMFGV